MPKGMEYRGPTTSLVPGIGRRATAIKPNDALYRWRVAYCMRGIRPVKVAVIGDSISFGSGISGGSVGVWNGFMNSFCVKLQQFLNHHPMYATNPVPGINEDDRFGIGGGYHLRTAVNTSMQPYPWTASTTPAPTLIARGRGGQTRGLPYSGGASAFIEHTAKNATAFYFVFEDGSGAVQPKFTITNMAGSVVTSYGPTMNTGLPQYTRSVTGSVVPRGTYKVRIENNTVAGTAVVDDVYVHDGDESAGVLVMNHAFPGLSTAILNAGDTRATTFRTTLQTLYSPDIMVINLGANDYGDNVNPATFQTNLSALIDSWRTQVGANIPILLLGWFQRWDILSPSFPWSQYATAIKTVAATKTNLEYFDMTPYFPTNTTDDDLNFDLVSSDNVHLSNNGHSYYAQIVADVLMRPFGGV